MQDELQMLKGQEVEVDYCGILYRGILLGETEEEIELLTTVGDRVLLPMDQILFVRKREGTHG